MADTNIVKVGVWEGWSREVLTPRIRRHHGEKGGGVCCETGVVSQHRAKAFLVPVLGTKSD